jgi:NDP-sugar pyrophosphorylase family protein
MKALLVCPGDRPAVPQLSEVGPLATLPVLGQCLAAHWVVHLAAKGVREVRVLAPDRWLQVRAALGDGAQWGVKVEVYPAASEPTVREALARMRSATEEDWLPWPDGAVLIDRLPGEAGRQLFESYAACFQSVVEWMPHALSPDRVRVSEIAPGIWVSRRSRIARTARLIAPCWIGDQVWVGEEAEIGPAGVLEDRCVVERGARVVESIVAPDTFVGKYTCVAHSLACGPVLTNWKTGSALRVPDPFLMCSLARSAREGGAAPAESALAALARMAATPLRKFRRERFA